MGQLVQFTDPSSGTKGLLDIDSGSFYDHGGAKIASFSPTDSSDRLALSDYAATIAYRETAQQAGRSVTMRANGTERLVAMDLGVADVHTPAAMPNFAGGYKLADGVADIACPFVQVAKQQDKYNIWDKENMFQRVQSNGGANGAGGVPEINPTLSTTLYDTKAHVLGAFIPTEVEANADAPLQPQKAAVKKIMNALLLEREIRVASLLTTTSNWDSNLVTNLASGAKWNGGASSDPIADLHALLEKSWMPVTAIIMSEQVHNAFVRNANVQKYIAYKSGAMPLPTDGSQSAPLLSLPPIYVAKKKYNSSGTALSYVWGTGCVLLHQPSQIPPSDQEDVATAYTFRWNGGKTADGEMTAGFLVRTYFDNRRGGRGGTMTVVVHNDAEVMTSNVVGGLITGCYQ